MRAGVILLTAILLMGLFWIDAEAGMLATFGLGFLIAAIMIVFGVTKWLVEGDQRKN